MGLVPVDPADCLSLRRGLVSTAEGSSSSVEAMGACLPGIMGARSFWFKVALLDDWGLSLEEAKFVTGVGREEAGLEPSVSSVDSRDLSETSLDVMVLPSISFGEAVQKGETSDELLKRD